MNSEQLQSAVRALMTVGGAALAEHGVNVSVTDWQTLTGAAVIIAGIVWSQFVHAKPKSPGLGGQP